MNRTLVWWVGIFFAFLTITSLINTINYQRVDAQTTPPRCFRIDPGGDIHTVETCDKNKAHDGADRISDQFDDSDKLEYFDALNGSSIYQKSSFPDWPGELENNKCYLTEIEYNLTAPIPHAKIVASLFGEVNCNTITTASNINGVIDKTALGLTEDLPLIEGNPGPADPVGGPTGEEEEQIPNDVDCITSSSFVFRWIVCPVLDVMFEVISFVYSNVILQLLVVDPLNDRAITGTPEAIIFDVWNSFRIIANVGFVIVFLLAIFGHMFSFALTPYELKKIIPRLAIGFIAVQLSWYIVAFTIDFVNILGGGLRALILSPVRGFSNTINLDFQQTWQDIGASLGLIGTGVVAWYSGTLISAIPLVLFPIIVGLVTVFVVLLLRKMLLLVLIVIAPLAFVAGILPNTSGILKKWWSLFSKALMMYPLIISLLAAGELFARVINAKNTVIAADGSKSAEDPIVAIVGIIAFFAPFFLVPMTFKWAGGAITALSGGMSKMGQGLNTRIFGETRDPYSYRGRRRARQVAFQKRKKARIIGASYKYGKGRYNPLRMPGYLGTRFGAGLTEQEGKLYQDAEKRLENIVGNGRDEEVYALLGDKNIFTDQDLPADAINAMRGKGLDSMRKDPYLVQVALNYATRKAGSTDELQRLSRNWQRGESEDGTTKYGGRLGHGSAGERARKSLWSRAADKHQYDHGDLKYRDFNDPNMGISKDLDKQTRMLHEANNTKGSFDMQKERGSYWEGMSEINSHAQSIVADAQQTGRAYTPQETSMLRELKQLHEGISGTRPTGAPIDAQNKRDQFQQGSAWTRGLNI